MEVYIFVIFVLFLGQNTFQFYYSLIYRKRDQEDYKEKSDNGNGTNVVALEALHMRDNNFVYHEENIQKKGNLR